LVQGVRQSKLGTQSGNQPIARGYRLVTSCKALCELVALVIQLLDLTLKALPLLFGSPI
jgi:hypothetical protein